MAADLFKKSLYVIGTPLGQEGLLPSSFAILKTAEWIVCESERVFSTLAKKSGIEIDFKKVYALDPVPSPKIFSELKDRISKTVTHGALLSDCGMPLLFDPGTEILEFSKSSGLNIHTLASSTSWGTACALSGYAPPFFLAGFLPQKSDARKIQLENFLKIPAHLVLMETPYRFKNLIEELNEVASSRELFLAWEMMTSQEAYFWGNAKRLKTEIEQKNLNKGEFVLIVKSR